MSDHQDSPNLEDLTPEEASRIIHAHRKVRYGTACWPCRQRKVKCDNQQPCENCVKRDHAQLCSYKPNRPSGKHGSAGSDGSAAKKKRALSLDEQDVGGPVVIEYQGEESLRVDRDNNDVTRYLGHNSIPALLKEQASPNESQEEYVRQDMRSIFGLDNSAPFPLMSSRHMDRLLYDISAELPSDREVMKLFRTYKDIPQLFWGFVLDIDDMETKLMVYLEERAKNAKNSTRPTKPVSASWLAILFAVLAVGSQYHDSPYHIRTRDSQRYIQISFHFLTVSNYLLRPNLDSIQALMLTGFVLLNDMKAEASWALLGVTCRLAQSLGLDRSPPLDGRESPDSRHREMTRRRLWWTCVWHDALTSLSFDRNPIASSSSRNCPIPDFDNPEGWAYLVGMYHLCQIISQRLNPDTVANTSYEQILETCQTVESIRDKMLPQIRNKDACKTALDRLRYFAIRLHTSYTISVCCRPALHREDDSRLTEAQKRLLVNKCKDNLTETVRMFLAMHQLSVIPTRSWAFTYHGLSSAVLLGILGETKADPEVRQLQGDLIDALSATAAKEKTSPSPVQKTDKDIELSGPLSRALMALKNIYDHGGVVLKGYRKGDRSGSRTPLQFSSTPQAMPEVQKVVTPFRTASRQSLDPHQDAALAMAEMQNGSGLADFHGSLPYVPQMPVQPVPISDITPMDPTNYMSPMEMYEQIFWESPDPWNNSLDLNFDFAAQPPPGQAQQQFYF